MWHCYLQKNKKQNKTKQNKTIQRLTLLSTKDKNSVSGIARHYYLLKITISVWHYGLLKIKIIIVWHYYLMKIKIRCLHCYLLKIKIQCLALLSTEDNNSEADIGTVSDIICIEDIIWHLTLFASLVLLESFDNNTI